MLPPKGWGYRAKSGPKPGDANYPPASLNKEKALKCIGGYIDTPTHMRDCPIHGTK